MRKRARRGAKGKQGPEGPQGIQGILPGQTATAPIETTNDASEIVFAFGPVPLQGAVTVEIRVTAVQAGGANRLGGLVWALYGNPSGTAERDSDETGDGALRYSLVWGRMNPNMRPAVFFRFTGGNWVVVGRGLADTDITWQTTVSVQSVTAGI